MINTQTILIVDDEVINRKVLIFALQKYHYRFLEAEDGLEGMNLVKNNPINLIFLDLMMPKMDGFEFLEWIKTQEGYKNIPVIVNSALSDSHYIQKALNYGSFDYFTKPIKSDVLHFQLPLKVKNALNFYQLLTEVIDKQRQLMEHNDYLKSELTLASELQRALLPLKIPCQPGIRAAAFYNPSEQLGGDFYDIIPDQSGYRLLVADVSGHGTPSALLTSAIKSYFNNLVDEDYSPSIIMNRMNESLYRLMKETDYFVTGIYAELHREPYRLIISNAGHPLPPVYHPDSDCFESDRSMSYFLGISPDNVFTETPINIETGDCILFYTDGIIEARNAIKTQYGVDRLKDVLRKNYQLDPNRLIEQIMKDLDLFLDGVSSGDDITLLVLKLD